jgi:hypothetical protein
MDNTYEPPGGDPREQSRPTEEFWPVRPASGGNPPPGYHDPRYHDPRHQDTRYQDAPGGPGGGPRRRNPLHRTGGLVAAGALAVGGVIAGASLAGHSSPAASTSAAANGTGAAAAAGPGTQAAALSAALNAADTPGTLALTSSSPGTNVSGASTGTAAVAHPCANAVKAARAARKAGHRDAARAALRAAGVRCLGWRHRLARVALLRGVDGQFTFRGQNGDLRTLAFERGIVQSVSGSNVVVRATDGTTWTWVLVSDTVVRESGNKTTTSALAAGEPVWAGGPVVSGAKDARLVVIRPPSGSSASSSPSPSPSASGS